MEIKFRTAITHDKEYIVFERVEFEKMIDVIKGINTVITDSIESYFGQIEFNIDEQFEKKRADAKSKVPTK